MPALVFVMQNYSITRSFLQIMSIMEDIHEVFLFLFYTAVTQLSQESLKINKNSGHISMVQQTYQNQTSFQQ